MKAQRLVIGLTVVNVIFVLIVLAQGTSAQGGPTVPESPRPLVRAQAVELVDQHGQTRARLSVEEPNSETVFRLIDANGKTRVKLGSSLGAQVFDARGRIRIKLGASEDGSGLLLANDRTEPGVQILAQKAGTSLTLRDGDRQRVIRPHGKRRR